MNYSALLNDKQLEAVQCTKGPLLIIAGAGSGKTRVITYRIAYLISEKHVSPSNIMAITFTNKAANEMRERVINLVGSDAKYVWISTFHSTCARILRCNIDYLGYNSSFSIYDTDDSKKTIKYIISNLNLDSKRFTPQYFQKLISYAKNHMINAEDLKKEAVTAQDENTVKVFEAYEETLFKNNSLDFDDLLIKTVELFEKYPDILETYQERFKYILVDEYQDTNSIQFKFIKLLASKYRNLCVVGDEDQSIYKFRGADIRNILDFENFFKDTKVIKLEQNYRSSGNILKAANNIIKNNTEHKNKTLWTSAPDGDLISHASFQTGYDEAVNVVSEIARRSKSESLNAFAILYRTNAQSRLFEEQFVKKGIPYVIVGGTNFYSRKEIKDILAYLKIIDNSEDELAIRRVINIPRRGIGEKSLEKIGVFAYEKRISFFEALTRASSIPLIGASGSQSEKFSLFIRKLRAMSEEIPVDDLIRTLINETGYVAALRSEGSEEAIERIENINEFISKAAYYRENSEDPSLNAFLQEVALVADIDSYDENSDKTALMTLHSAKGLEFDNVYIVGAEDGLFPSFHSIFDADQSLLEEERRLFYVGMTRARKTLKITSAQHRFLNGEQEAHKVSRFLEEIPTELIKEEKFLGYQGSNKSKLSGGYYFESIESLSTVKANKSSNVIKTSDEIGKFNFSQFKISKPETLDYKVGDTVLHKKFGTGRVINIKEGERDFEVAVEFEKCGTKRMFAGFAKLRRKPI